MSRTIGPMMAAIAAAWCVGVGVWLWVRPWSPGLSFADVSALGATPLVIPAAIATFGAWSAYSRRRWGLAISLGLMLLFVALGGFSIGPAYVPALGALAWALAAEVDSRRNVAER